MTSSSGLSTRVFGYSKVKWQIENFSFQIKDVTQNIQSPDFTVNGSEETIWRMNVRIKFMEQKNFVFFTLIRSAIDSGPKHVWLNLKMCCVCSDEKCICHNLALLSLEKGSKHEVFLGTTTELLSKMRRSSDLLTILCHLIVYSNNGSRGHEDCNHEGLKLLSKNMLHLYKSAENFDTKIMLRNNYILAHKAVLYVRNRYLSLLFDEDDDEVVEEFQDCTVIDFSDTLDYKGMDKILSYLYTGDIRHVLKKPSYGISNCASFLDISEIQAIYKPDELSIKSTIDLQERTYILRGYAFENSRLTWQFNAEGPAKIYRLLFYPKKEHNEDYITLFAETFEKNVRASLKCDVADKNGHLSTLSDVILPDSSVDIDEVIKNNFRLRHCYQFIEVVLKLKLTTGIKASHIDRDSKVCVSYENGIFYEYFSADMEFLCDEGPFRDTLIDNNGVPFWVHKCILASRFKLFSEMLVGDVEEIVVLNIEPRILSILLHYIYTGSITDVIDEDVIDVYKAAVLSDLPLLKSMCSDLLKLSSKVNRHIRCRVVKIAEIYKDASLMEAVLNHLFDKKDEVLIPTQPPFSFRDAPSCRFC